MGSETKRRLDRLAWKGRARVALAIVLGLAALAAGYAFIYWPDPVVETQIVSGEVTALWRPLPKWEIALVVIRVSLEDGRVVEFSALQR